MRIRFITLVVFALLTNLMSTAYALGSGTKAVGNFILTSGERLDSITFEMPNAGDSQVKIILEGKKQKLSTDSIDCILLWNKKYPAEKHILKPFKIDLIDLDTGEMTGETRYKLWMCCDQVEDNASYWMQIGRPSFKKGNLQFNYRAASSWKSTRYVLKRGCENPSHIPDKTGDVKKWVKIYFNDDPVVMRKVDAGEYDGSDWGYKYVDIRRIIADYNPGR